MTEEKNTIELVVVKCKNGYYIRPFGNREITLNEFEVFTNIEELKKEVSRKIDQLAINRELEIAKITD